MITLENHARIRVLVLCQFETFDILYWCACMFNFPNNFAYKSSSCVVDHDLQIRTLKVV